MKKRIVLAIIATFLLCLVAPAQEKYERYYKMYNDAMALKNKGELDDAKTILLNIKKLLEQGGIPKGNDLDAQIAKCTTISFTYSDGQMLFEPRGKQPKSVTVKTNSETFSVRSDTTWCKVSKKNKYVTVRCEDNEKLFPRNARVFVSADGKTSYFDVTQKGDELELSLDPEEVEFSSKSETALVSVVTNAPSWSVIGLPDWVYYEKSDTKLVLKSAQNEIIRSREAKIFVEIDDEQFPLILRQAGADTILSVSKKELSFGASASKQSLALISNIENLKLDKEGEWIDVSCTSDSIMVQVQENDSAVSRKGLVTVGWGTKKCEVIVYQEAALLPTPKVNDGITEVDPEDKPIKQDTITIKSWPSHLKVTVKDDNNEIKATEYTPFVLAVDNHDYYLTMGLESRKLQANRKQEVFFRPGFRFAAFTWAPKAAIGMMSGFVGSGSWGGYGHFQASIPVVTDFDDVNRTLAGYNMTLGPVFCPQEFPYMGIYVGVGAGAYKCEPHYGFDFEAGVMGFYKNMTLTMGFHSSRVSSTVKSTEFMIGVGGYLKRYYDEDLGYCSSDSRRWLSLNYVFRPAENGKGLMIGDIGNGLTRPYVKVMFMSSDSLETVRRVKEFEGGAGLVFTPMSGIIDLCAGASVRINVEGKADPYQGVGAELGAIINVWRFPFTVFIHKSDVFGEPRLFVDFGIGFHLGGFLTAKSTYQ